MTALLLGQILGVSFACGLNLYLTVAALGLLSRLDIIDGLPPGLHGLEGTVVIVSAGLLFLIEGVIDKIRHADSLWDTLHTFIRPPAAALLAVGAMWGEALSLVLLGAAIAFLVALIAHGTKAGVRLALNAGQSGGQAWVSIAEDVLAIAFAVMAFLDPSTALVGTATVLLILLLVGPRYWRAFRLGLRALLAWYRTLFSAARWREVGDLPRRIRRQLAPIPLGAAPPRGARACLHGFPGAGAYRNGWLLITADGATFIYRTLLGHRRVDLPAAHQLEMDAGVWADIIRIRTEDGTPYRLYMLKDGPTLDMTLPLLQETAP